MNTMASGNIMKINVTFYDEEDNKIQILPGYQQIDDYPKDTIEELHQFSIKVTYNNNKI